jgi:hypothetical protein
MTVQDEIGHYRLKCFEPSMKGKVGFLSPCDKFMVADETAADEPEPGEDEE